MRRKRGKEKTDKNKGTRDQKAVRQPGIMKCVIMNHTD